MTEKEELSGTDIFRKVPVLFVLPFIIGFVCYLKAGIGVSDALYYAMNLYFLNYYEVDLAELCMQNHVWIAAGVEFARWVAPLMTATAVLLQFQRSYQWLHAHRISLLSKSTIIYGDTERSQAFCNNIRHAAVWTGAPIRCAARHVLMFPSDFDSLDFYDKNRSRFRGKEVFICMNGAGATSLKDRYLNGDGGEQTNIRFFNYNDTVARLFWKKRALWLSGKKNWKIAIIGFGELGVRMLETALQLNLFAEDQSIEYDVFGDSGRYQYSHAGMKLMNGDHIHYYALDSKEQWECMDQMDMIILTKEYGSDQVQAVLGCSSCEVYVYSPDGTGLSAFFASMRLHVFGEYQEVLTEENIMTDKLYQHAIELNAHYANVYSGVGIDTWEQKQAEWRCLSGFLKSSNISAADFGEVLYGFSKKDMDLFARLEHIRWCRFHFLHYWKYGILENGSNKDEERRIHRCLQAFDELDPVDQQKDYDSVQVILDLLKTKDTRGS